MDGDGTEEPDGTQRRRPGRGRRPRGTEMEIGRSAGTVNSVARALSILDAFEQAGRMLGNQEIAQFTGLPKSTVSRITRTLTELRYLHFRPDIEKYQLGPKILVLANVLQRMDPVATLIQPALQELANATRGTVGFGIIDGTDALYLQVARGVSMILLQVEVGTRMPLLSSAIGLALLGGSSEQTRSKLLARIGPGARSGGMSGRQALDKTLQELSQRGYCTSVGTWSEGINGVAVPLRLAGDNMVHAINIGVPEFLVDEEKLHSVLGPKLLSTVIDLEKRGLVRRIFV